MMSLWEDSWVLDMGMECCLCQSPSHPQDTMAIYERVELVQLG